MRGRAPHRTFAGPDRIVGGNPAPPIAATGYWFEASRLVTADVDTLAVTAWGDFTGHGWNLQESTGGHTLPTLVGGSVNGQPGIYFGNPFGGGASTEGLFHYGGPFDTVPGNYPPGTPYPFAQNQPHIVYVVCLPKAGTPPGGGTNGGMIVSDRLDGFMRQLWTLAPTQQRLARRAGTNILAVNPAVPNVGVPLFIMYQWTGTDMIITVNGVVQATIDLISGLPSTAFPFSADNIGTHYLEVGGSPVDETGFQGDLNLVVLRPDATPSPAMLAYINATYGL